MRRPTGRINAFGAPVTAGLWLFGLIGIVAPVPGNCDVDLMRVNHSSSALVEHENRTRARSCAYV
jgi:hypothetical protein